MNIKTTISKWLSENLPMSQNMLAKTAGVQQSDVSRLKKGGNVGFKNVSKILDALGAKIIFPDESPLTREVVFVENKKVEAANGTTLPDPNVEDYFAVPLMNDVGAGHGAVPNDEFKSWFLVYRYGDSIKGRSNLIAVRLLKTADSMEPILHPEDIVLIDRDDRVIREGKIYLVMSPEGDGKIKRVKTEDMPDKKDTRIIFYSENSAEHPSKEYSLRRHFAGDWKKAIVGRAVWSWSDITKR